MSHFLRWEGGCSGQGCVGEGGGLDVYDKGSHFLVSHFLRWEGGSGRGQVGGGGRVGGSGQQGGGG